MRVLITGGAGFIGTRTGAALLARGYEVTVLDLQLDRPAPWWSAPGVRIVEGDVRDRDCVAAALAGADACWHLAAAHHDSGIDEETYFSVNEQGTRILCEEMARRGVRSLCFFSSVAVYGPSEDRERLAPDNPYGRSKLAAEHVVHAWLRESGARALIVRPAVVFGEDNFANTYALMRQIHSGTYWPVGPGRNAKSMAYVDNLVPAAIEAWLALREGELRSVNYVDKPDLTSAQIAAALAAAFGRRVPGPPIPAPLARALLTPVDALSRLLGRPTALWPKVRKFSLTETVFSRDLSVQGSVGLEEALARTAEWYAREGRHQPARRALPPSETRRGHREWRPSDEGVSRRGAPEAEAISRNVT